MSEHKDFEIIKPSVLSIIKAKITDSLIKKINEYVNQITLDKIKLRKEKELNQNRD